MNAREHDIDFVAHGMTAGAPATTFAARVMAPICGRPQPGFTGRVMAQIDWARPGRRPRALQAALAAAGALAIVAGATLWLPDDAPTPVPPRVPIVAATPLKARAGAPALPARVKPPSKPIEGARELVTSLAPQLAIGVPEATSPVPGPRSIRLLAPLQSPATLTVRAIEAEPRTTPPLPGLDRLTIPTIRIDKERP